MQLKQEWNISDPVTSSRVAVRTDVSEDNLSFDLTLTHEFEEIGRVEIDVLANKLRVVAWQTENPVPFVIEVADLANRETPGKVWIANKFTDLNEFRVSGAPDRPTPTIPMPTMPDKKCNMCEKRFIPETFAQATCDDCIPF